MESPDYAQFPQVQITLDGFPIHVVDAGSGPPVVLVHGSPVSSYSFRHQIAALMPRFRVIAPDLPGFGRSAGPEQGVAFRRQSELLRRLLDHLQLDSFRLVGHDWGGPVALAATSDRLDRVEQLALINTTFRSTFQPPAYWRLFTARGVGDLLLVRANVFGRGLPLLLNAAKSSDVREEYRRHLEHGGTRRTVLALERLTGYADLMGEVEAALAAHPVPTLIVWGQPDPYFRQRELDWLRERLPQAEVVTIPGGGHFPQEDAPQAVTEALLRFFGG